MMAASSSAEGGSAGRDVGGSAAAGAAKDKKATAIGRKRIGGLGSRIGPLTERAGRRDLHRSAGPAEGRVDIVSHPDDVHVSYEVGDRPAGRGRPGVHHAH